MRCIDPRSLLNLEDCDETPSVFQPAQLRGLVGRYDGSRLHQDMNGDGKLDIALVSDPEPTGTAGVLLGRGDGTFGETAYAVGHDTAAIEVGDLDGDGKLDVATVGKTSDGIGKLSVLLGKGDGTLAAPTDYGLPGTPSLVRLADVNGDGRLDVVTASSDVTT